MYERQLTWGMTVKVANSYSHGKLQGVSQDHQFFSH